MIPGDTGERRADLKSRLLERMHDPLQLRITVLGIVLFLGYSGVYLPLDAQISATKQELVRERKLADLASSLEQLQSQCRSFAKRLPQQADSKEWMQYMHEGVRSFPLKLSKLDCLPPRKVGPYPIVVLKLELEGSYYDLDQFLRWIESNPRLLRADEIDISLAKIVKVVEKGKDKSKDKSKEVEKEPKDDMVMRVTVLGLAG